MNGIVLNIKASLDHSGRDHDQHAADLVFFFVTCRVYKVEFRGTLMKLVVLPSRLLLLEQYNMYMYAYRLVFSYFA